MEQAITAELSVVVPAYNEADSLKELAGEILSVFEGLERPCEAIFVDDGSSDGTCGVIRNLAEEDERIWYAIPKEGGVIWADNLCIPESAPNKHTALVFIDYLLRAEVAAANSNFAWYASPNTEAEDFIEEEILEEPAIYPPPEVMAKLEWLEDVGDATPIYERLWTEVKAAGP